MTTSLFCKAQAKRNPKISAQGLHRLEAYGLELMDPAAANGGFANDRSISCHELHIGTAILWRDTYIYIDKEEG